jgi:putative hydrolase of the HAD superfamily
MRAILFDFGGTLDSPRHWLDRFVSHYRSAGVDISRIELEVAYGAATRTAYGAGMEIRTFGLGKLVRYLVDLQLATLRSARPSPVRRFLEAAAAGDELDRIAERIAGRFVAESRCGLEQSCEVLSRLAPRFKIGVVSNFYGNLDRVLAEAKIADLVAVVVDSSRLGYFKPDSRIFEAALDNLEIAAVDTVMVGDSLDKDCAPARRLGMRTVWLQHGATSAQEQPSTLADYTIHQLEEVETLRW